MKTRILTEQELEIMKVAWERKTVTVRDVYEALRERKTVAYTTVMTMMNVLERKGHVRREAEGRSYRYHPVRARGQVVAAMVREFVDRVFGGSAEPLLVHLVEDKRVTAAELDRLARRIRGKKS